MITKIRLLTQIQQLTDPTLTVDKIVLKWQKAMGEL